MKNTQTDYRLTMAALNARDALRAGIVPAVDKLTGMVAGNPEALKLLANVRTLAGQQADGLRLAIKNRQYRTR